MFREIPVSNRLLSKKWDKINNERHYNVMKNIKPAINNARPSCFREQRPSNEAWRQGSPQAERRKKILEENMKMIEKITNIKNKPLSFDTSNNAKSLNQTLRNQQARDIKAQNEAIVRRIKAKTSFYTAKAWEAERKANQKLLRVICQYPYTLGTKRHKSLSPESPTKNTSALSHATRILDESNK